VAVFSRHVMHLLTHLGPPRQSPGNHASAPALAKTLDYAEAKFLRLSQRYENYGCETNIIEISYSRALLE